MVLAEVVQNAVQHGYRPGDSEGQVAVTVRRSARELEVTVTDDGTGLPAGFSLERAPGLGLQIVRTLVDSELRGSISMRRRDDGSGAQVQLQIPLKGRT
jgi:two-component sensor histidine kinase